MAETDRPRRLAFCITDLDVGGAERALVQLVTRLDRNDWEPAVFCLSGPGALVAELQQSSIPVVCLGAKSIRNVSIAMQLRRELSRFRPELLQTFLFHANLVGRWAAWCAGVPRVVCGIRVAERRTRVHLWLDRWTQGLVDRYVCVSQGVAEFSIRVGRLPPEKIEVIRNGVDIAQFEQARPADLTQFGIPSSCRVVVSVARLDPQKGLRDLIQAAAILTRAGSDLHFLIVGEGTQRREIEHLIAQRGLTERVHLAGQRADVPQILRAAFCCVLSSHWEGMPNAVLEAMAAGLPVVATRVEGTGELVTEGETGLLVAPHSPGELADAIGTLGTAPDRAARMGLAGQTLVRNQFSWDRVVEHYSTLYKSLLATGTTSRH